MPSLKRRHFVLGSVGAAGALAIGWSALPQRRRLNPSTPLAAAPGQTALNGWVKVSADNTVTVVMSQAEMGQGAHTGLAMLLADEMDADWARVKLEQSTLDAIYNNQSALIDSLPFQPDDHGFVKRTAGHVVGKLMREIPGLLGTGGSSSVTDQWLPMREAGASARAMLIAAAAAKWHVPVRECRAEAGRVLHASGRSAAFGELAAGAAQLGLPKHSTARPSSASTSCRRDSCMPASRCARRSAAKSRISTLRPRNPCPEYARSWQWSRWREAPSCRAKRRAVSRSSQTRRFMPCAPWPRLRSNGTTAPLPNCRAAPSSMSWRDRSATRTQKFISRAATLLPR
jgi:hypothetical protein